MKFAAIIEYAQDKAKIAEIPPVHRQYLSKLRENGQLVASGPFTDDSGALIIYEAPSPAGGGEAAARRPVPSERHFREMAPAAVEPRDCESGATAGDVEGMTACHQPRVQARGNVIPRLRSGLVKTCILTPA